ncbi:hypothetical protein K0M31_012812 [Melipona bicolor]|uniref:Uncharacterized protein n=1 Tax=Melipona bicolor TaxID=60889 RepID=A0AA40KH27_9HYME|nr:hypothetical protein K0M31_012812 [Melipona bicolor]
MEQLLTHEIGVKKVFVHVARRLGAPSISVMVARDYSKKDTDQGTSTDNNHTLC